MRSKRQKAACLLFKRLTLKLVYALVVYALKDKYNHALKEAVGSFFFFACGRQQRLQLELQQVSACLRTYKEMCFTMQ